MKRRLMFAFIGLLLVSAAEAADTSSCTVRKGLYESWLSLAKHTTSRTTKSDALLSAAPQISDAPTAQGIGDEYRTFFQCLSNAAVPADEEGGRSFCKDAAAADHLGGLACQTAMYLKTGRTGSKEFLDALPASKKSAEIVLEFDAIANASSNKVRYPSLFLPDGPAYKLVDELFVLVLDDKDTAAAKYFHIVGSATGPAARHMDAQIKILLRESPAVVVKQWAVLRQHQAKLKKLLSELASELPAAEMKKLRQGIVGFCSKDNLDCPEILKTFGRPD